MNGLMEERKKSHISGCQDYGSQLGAITPFSQECESESLKKDSWHKRQKFLRWSQGSATYFKIYTFLYQNQEKKNEDKQWYLYRSLKGLWNEGEKVNLLFLPEIWLNLLKLFLSFIWRHADAFPQHLDAKQGKQGSRCIIGVYSWDHSCRISKQGFSAQIQHD